MCHMCGRYSLSSDPAQPALELDAIGEASAPPPGRWPDRAPASPRFNIAPTTTAEKPAFRSAVARRRCVVPIYL